MIQYDCLHLPFQIMILFPSISGHPCSYAAGIALAVPYWRFTKSTQHQDPSMFLRFFKKISETTKSIVEDFAFVRDQYHNFKKDWTEWQSESAKLGGRLTSPFW